MPKKTTDGAGKSTHKDRHEPIAVRRKGTTRASHRRDREPFGREGGDTRMDLSGQTARCFGCRNRFGLVGLIVLSNGVLCCRRCLQRREELQIPELWDAAASAGSAARKLTH